MTGFYLWAAALVVAAAAFVTLVSRVWQRPLDGESNLDWLRLRQQELQEDSDDDVLLTDAELRILEELPAETAEAAPGRASGAGWIMLFAALVLALVPLAIYRQVGAIEDVRIAQALDALDGTDIEQIEQLLRDIEARAQDKPGNADYLSLLGQYYTAQERHDDALGVFEQLLELFPENPEVLARAAQAEYLSLNRQLNQQAKRRAEAALAADPNQRTALGTLGMASFESGDYVRAIDYWQRLLAFEAPGSPGYQMLESVIAEARQRGNVPEPTVAEEGVMVTVTLPEGVDLPPSSVVFIIARPSGASGMPTAAVRQTVGEWPLVVRLDDSNSMAGQLVSNLSEVDIEVQVSETGQPGKANASWLARADNVVPSADAAVELTLTPATQ